MKRNIVRRMLVGMITLTTMFSSLGSSVVYAGEFDSDAPIVAMSGDENGEGADPESDGAEPSDAANEYSTVAIDGEDFEEDFDEDSDADDDASNIDDTSEDGATTEDTASAEDTSEVVPNEDAASLEDTTEEDLPAAPLAGTATQTIEPELGNPDFGEITDAYTSQTTISSTEQEIEVGFSFRIYNAESIPDGKFTYKLPSSLDFSKAVGLYIPVIELVEEDGVQKEVEIGSARVGSDNIMSFEIKTDDLEKKPNGLLGSVGFKCKVNPSSIQGDGSVDIAFSDTKHIRVYVQEAIIEGKKENYKIPNKKPWTVTFNVSADVTNFEITDVLGSNLKFVGGYTLSGGTGVSFELVDDHTLKVHADSIARGNYTLTYQVEAIDKSISTDGLSEDEIFAVGNGNTVTWTWDGATQPGEDKGYATMTDNKLVSKFGKNNYDPNSIATVLADGKVNWEVFINGGSFPEDISGYTLVDMVDSRMVFLKDSLVVYASDNRTNWDVYSNEFYSVEYDSEDEPKEMRIKFPENTPVKYFKIAYTSKISGKLPGSKTTYTNNCYLYNGNELLDEASRNALYKFSGEFDLDISKEITKERDSKGYVSWTSHFSVNGDNNNYVATIIDTISPASNTLNGKAVSSVIVPGSVFIYRIADDGTEKKLHGAHTSVTVTGNSFKIIAKALQSGNYVIYYKTQDFYGDESADIHSYPQGSVVRFNNHIQVTIDKVVKSDDKYYEVTSEGLPMMKEASAGYYDSTSGEYVIPWKITVNKNSVGQMNQNITAGMEAEVVDILPANLVYRAGSAKISKVSGETIATAEPVITVGENGTTKLTWAFKWPEGMSGTDNACELSFVSTVDKAYFAGLVNGNNSANLTFSFDNIVNGSVGGSTGNTTGISANSLTILDKRASYNEAMQLIDYSIVVNDGALDLVDGDTVVLSDDITNGFYVNGSLHVYEYAGGTKGAEISIPAPKVTKEGASVEITVPDSKALIVEYQVRANAATGEDVGDGKIKVSVSNTATLRGKVSKSDTEKGDFIFNKVTANISSAKGAIRITKVDSDNTANGLAGAKFGLYRVNLMDKSTSEIAVKVTTDPYFNITFSEDGKYDSLIFDTLYYYEELEAPKDYQRDPYKHFVIFRSSKFDTVIADVKDYVNSYAKAAGLAKADLEIVDVQNSGKTAEFVFKNSKKPEDKIVVPPTDPEDPPKENETTTTTGTSTSTSTSTSKNVFSIFGNINPVDLPEVLGASRNPEDLPEVLGARRSATEDRSMAGSVCAIIMSLAALAVLMTKRDKKDRTTD
ncbi:MAG: hypothetical protein IJI01_13015 [Butyrivibrio sp.]|uniref:SpaA isopeptide-forming pilin-related protein n=1 Tax=Butyrivibrio sp. TaxID=28121 RepID=UPI0025BCB6F2|nr:SpaA isopeptide-forming pilin-related protein [Butyrivibrio sp.]MBQ6589581.1 hypothetical protein [Butyrivibrio sp.]